MESLGNPVRIFQEFHVLVNSSWKIEIPCQFCLKFVWILVRIFVQVVSLSKTHLPLLIVLVKLRKTVPEITEKLLTGT